jgi:hypothetical protein
MTPQGEFVGDVLWAVPIPKGDRHVIDDVRVMTAGPKGFLPAR